MKDTLVQTKVKVYKFLSNSIFILILFCIDRFSKIYVIELAEKFKIDMPITKAVKQVISGEKISNVINKLLSRPFQFEE